MFESSKVKGVRNLNRRKLQHVLSEYDKVNNDMIAMHKSKKEQITKAEPYYKIKSDLMNRLRYQKDKVDRLRNELIVAKNEYKESMKIIEKMNEDMHQERNNAAKRNEVNNAEETTENSGEEIEVNTTEEDIENTEEESEGNTEEENEVKSVERNKRNTAKVYKVNPAMENEGNTTQEKKRNAAVENE